MQFGQNNKSFFAVIYIYSWQLWSSESKVCYKDEVNKVMYIYSPSAQLL